MQYFVRRPFDLPARELTEESVYAQRGLHRRQFLAEMGLAGLAGTLLAGCSGDSDEAVLRAGRYGEFDAAPIPTAPTSEVEGEDTATKHLQVAAGGKYPARRNEQFAYGREQSREADVARYANFYEFTGTKAVWKHVAPFKPLPWQFEVDGLCAKPRKFDLDDLWKNFSIEERHYRHRCVETWAMCVPWTGLLLRDLLTAVEPTAQAKYVEFTTFERPEEATRQADKSYPWPYREGLTLPEAMNELTLLAVGIYGHPLPKQHGAPVRLVVPWKYGFKSCKSIVKITLTDRQPATFWNTLIPEEYDFPAIVNPQVPHPRWSQATEWMLGSRERFETKLYNGYGEYVAGLYPESRRS